jgi:hypothetical protein
MLRPSILLVSLGAALGAQAPAADRLAAAPSTRATTVVNLAGPRGSTLTPATITIDYGQPHLRGRTLHTGNLVPLDSVWRLGANATTVFETGVDLDLGGRTVPKGKYTLYALPSASGSWKLIVSKDTSQTPEYKVDQDLVRVDLQKRTLPAPVEALTIWLIPSGQPGTAAGDLRILWGTTELSTRWSMK